MRAIFLIFAALVLVVGCATPHTTLTEKERELAAFLAAHGFARDGRVDYSRRYAAVQRLKDDFSLSNRSMIPVPNGPDGGADTRVFTYEGLGFVVIADDGKSLDDPKAGCSVSVSFDQVSGGDGKPRMNVPNQPSEPTPTSVTTPAAQEIAPAAVVAHL